MNILDTKGSVDHTKSDKENYEDMIRTLDNDCEECEMLYEYHLDRFVGFLRMHEKGEVDCQAEIDFHNDRANELKRLGTMRDMLLKDALEGTDNTREALDAFNEREDTSTH